MELRHLRYFAMAAEEANISRAAARLNVSQPAVSRQIRDLEEELGAALFERRHDGLRLTEAGRTALWHAREVLRQTTALEDAMRAFASGTKTRSLKIGYIATALPGFLADGLRRFHRQHDAVCVEIQEMSPAEQEKALRAGNLDLAFLGSPSAGVKRKFRVEAIRKVPMVAAVPADHRLARRRSIDLSELADDPFLSLHENHFPGRPELLEELCRKAGSPLKVALKVGGLSEILGLVASGSGVAVVPADLAELPHSGVVFLKLKKPKITLVSSAAWRADRESADLLELLKLVREATP